MIAAENDVRGVREFLERFARFQATHQSERISAFKAKFGAMARAMSAIQAASQETDRLTGRRFNIFQVLGVERSEVRTHSALLAALLDPEGSHGQGDLFLREFVATLRKLASVRGEPLPMAYLPDETWCVVPEKLTAEGRLDIVLEAPRVVIAIENKIGAGDQPEQLHRYDRWLESQRKWGKTCALVYLTLDGHESPSAGKADYYRVSYHAHIRDWIERCIRELPAARLRDLLEQYRNTIASL